MADQKIPSIEVELNGHPLSDLGLQCAMITFADGRKGRLAGFVVPHGKAVHEALQDALPPGASVSIEHDWLEHYDAQGRVTGRVCTGCWTYEAQAEAAHEHDLSGPMYDPTHGEEDAPREGEQYSPGAARPTAYEENAKKQTSSADRWWGKSVIYGKEDEHATPYMTRYWIGRLRLHVFHRGDQDPDCHDHPWDFWTFPFTPYVEEVAVRKSGWKTRNGDTKYIYETIRQVVPAWRLTFRPATHTHRVLGRYEGFLPPEQAGDDPCFGSRPIVTLVWRSKPKRKWGFLKNRDGQWCWVPWKAYVFGGGKHAPCE